LQEVSLTLFYYYFILFYFYFKTLRYNLVYLTA